MAGLVIELQNDSLNSEIKVSSLLRKALSLSKKLNVTEIEGWLKNELDGYYLTTEIPKYRTVRGELKVCDSSHVWRTLDSSDISMPEELFENEIRTQIGKLESFSEKNGGIFQLPLPQDIANELMKHLSIPIRPSFIFDKTEIIGILDAVRNNILNWSFELKQKGILGEGMSFSNEEKKIAHQTTFKLLTILAVCTIHNFNKTLLVQHSL